MARLVLLAPSHRTSPTRPFPVERPSGGTSRKAQAPGAYVLPRPTNRDKKKTGVLASPHLFRRPPWPANQEGTVDFGTPHGRKARQGTRAGAEKQGKGGGSSRAQPRQGESASARAGRRSGHRWNHSRPSAHSRIEATKGAARARRVTCMTRLARLARMTRLNPQPGRCDPSRQVLAGLVKTWGSATP